MYGRRANLTWGAALLLVCLIGTSQAGVLVAAGSSWKYVKGTQEASLPHDAWREQDFDDSSWPSGNAPIGFPSTAVNTHLSDMQNSYSSFFVRKTFNVTSLDPDDRLRVSVTYDDGFIIWINGERVKDENEPDGAPTYDSVASAYLSGQTNEVFELGRASGVLDIGENVIAIQAFNINLGSSDCLIDAELSAYRKVADTTFSHDRGFYSAPFTCTIGTATAGATILYTLDGSDPLISSTRFTIGASSGAASIDPDSSTGRAINGQRPPCVVLRAAAVKSGYAATDVDTQTYLFLDKVLRQPNVMSGETWVPGEHNPSTSVDNTASRATQKMDTRMASDVVDAPAYAPIIKDTLQEIPSICVNTKFGHFFRDADNGVFYHSLRSGFDYEHPGSAELIYPDGRKGFQINCGVRMSGGGANRDCRWKHKISLSLRFRSIYGPDKLEYDLFPDSPVKTFDHIRLRAQGNDKLSGDRTNPSSYVQTELRDSFGRKTQQAMGWITPHETWAHLYLNGLYWGLYNIVEVPDAAFMRDHFGGAKDDYDVLANKKWYLMIDPPATEYPRILDGADADFLAMKSFARNNDLAVAANYAQMQQYLDVEQHIDYLIVQIYGPNHDWCRPHATGEASNWRAGRRSRPSDGGAPGKFQYFVWDYEGTLGGSVEDGVYTNLATTKGPELLHENLKANREYKVVFGDRVYKHFFNGGAMTTEACTNRWIGLKQTIERVVIPELARWGDVSIDSSNTPDNWWRPNVDWVLNSWLSLRSPIVVGQFRSAGLYPSLDPPTFQQHGGAIAAGFKLTMSNPNSSGVIYYALDGSDPRNAGGNPSAGKIQYAGAVTLSRTTHVQARIYKTATTWSAVHAATFNFTAHYSNIRITEIMYNPLGGRDFEFVEIQNTGSATRGLSEMTFNGIRYAFPPGTELDGGEMAVLAANEAVFTNRYPGVKSAVRFFAAYDGGLDN
ncbi:MAG: CotH kinase family protein, partial [Kiritimatiellae bacterium]|nr:CotH kinase family protein [Kiritimatiellia bacterium]